MAIGVPPRRTNKKKIPIYITYEGKLEPDKIVNKEFGKYILKKKVNGEGDNQFFFGDNLDVLLFLLHEKKLAGKVKLVYIDPPFATESSFLNRNQTHAYSDEMAGAEFVEFLRERIILLYELLSDDGSMYLHLDSKMAFTMKLIMDEIFGEKNCKNFITRKKCSTKNYTRNTY